MSTSSTSSASSTTTPGFSGTSTFASQLQTVITRSVAIASMPITQLQNDESTLTSQQSELQSLGTDFTNLQSAFSAVDSAASSGSMAATVDATTVASAAVSTGALAGTYSVDISSMGSLATALSNPSLPKVSDPTVGNISTSSAFTLTVNGNNYTLKPTANNLNGLVNAINSSGANVQATVVNVGGSTSPNYELSVQGTQYAPTTIQLNDGTQNLMSTLTNGAYVAYTVNGEPATTPATSTSRTLDISTGLTVTALATGTANVTVAQNIGGVSSALSSLVTSFNAAQTELTNNRGQNGGALSGDSIVGQLSNLLQSLGNYSTGTGNINSLAAVGLSYNQNGQLQFDQSTFDAAASSSPSDVMNFLGSEGDVTGFLGAASQAMTQAVDPTSGIIATEINAVGSSVNHITAQISNDQDRVNQLQTSLTAQMASADAAIASLQSQETQITDLFAAETTESQALNGN
jgi:flagellar hook-associated protein 2